MISAKDFFKKLKAIAKRDNLPASYTPEPKGLTDPRYFEAINKGINFEKDCSSIITAQESLRKIITQVQYLQDESQSRMAAAGYPTLITIATSEEDKETISTLFELLPKLIEMEAFAKAAWKAKIGKKEVKEVFAEVGE